MISRGSQAYLDGATKEQTCYQRMSNYLSARDCPIRLCAIDRFLALCPLRDFAKYLFVPAIGGHSRVCFPAASRRLRGSALCIKARHFWIVGIDWCLRRYPWRYLTPGSETLCCNLRASASSTAVCLPLPVADNLGYRSDSNRPLLSNIRPMQIITTIMSITSGVCSLTKHKESISSVMLRTLSNQGNCAEAGPLRKEFGILGLRYAGRIQSPLPVSGIAALRPVSRFLRISRVGA